MTTASSALGIIQTPAGKRPAPQQAKYIKDIKAALSSNNLTIIVGSGVSINAIHAVNAADMPGRSLAELKRVAESMSWLGLLRHGLYYLMEEDLLSNSDDKKEREDHINILESRATPVTEDQLRAAASFLTRKLFEARKIDNWYALEFEDVYQECIGHDPNPILDALKELYECGARIITTNYDDLLEKHISAQRILIDNTVDAKLFFAKRTRGILHVHGVWWHSACDCQSVE
ncbi:uncharacterized protein PAC_14939 [Phialocephala subalpina]|uniref:SIR2-like domain-containing protein n=1 Tax=Phialocephala subalpina TaxID=576137 RepID=A0A1L7XJ18_9HELO|nr:uncharacterized protein PAC_14939 [Phialocephala subalpina]